MANMRLILMVLLVFMGYSLWVQWQQDYHPITATATATQDEPALNNSAADVPTFDTSVRAPAVESSADLPSIPRSAAAEEASEGASVGAQSPRITVLTDVLKVEIDLVGGTIVNAWLLDYPVQVEFPEIKVQIFNAESNRLYIAQSGLLSSDQSVPTHNDRYQAAQMNYALRAGEDEIRIPLTWESEGGIKVTKTIIFKRGAYDIEIRHYLTNNSPTEWQGSGYMQLQRAGIPSSGTSFIDPSTFSFIGAAMYTPEDKLEKLHFEDFQSEPTKITTNEGWIAMIQHYFFAAWIPQPDQDVMYSTAVVDPNGWTRYIVRAVAPSVSVAANSTHEFIDQLYVGPKLQDELDDVAPGLSLTVDYGIFTVMSKPLFWLLSFFHDLVNNWGFAIILLTLSVKLAFFKLTEAQYKSMARMRKLQPRIEQMKARYGEDKQRMSQEMMKLYKKEKVNPLGGCLPMLVQFPVFIALYWVLLESVELRQAPFMLWIQNLSVRDPYFVLPVLNGIFMVLTQRLSPTPGMDPMQRKIMQAMPVAFSVMFAFFPAGLVLYWATNAGLSLLQQWYITRKIAAMD
ncbi:MAG: membrane protein insertase YidC [Xanthomonadales bacterium]|nr:membrane protein insertase YidC [Xanthomonadales bacterium]